MADIVCAACVSEADDWMIVEMFSDEELVVAIIGATGLLVLLISTLFTLGKSVTVVVLGTKI